MFAIARKTSFFYITHLCTFCAPAFPALMKGEGGIISMLAFWVPLWLSSSVLWSEKQESYALLRMLPVTDRQVVRAKFGLPLAATFVYWLILSVFNWWAWNSRWEYPFYVALANLTCALSLPLAAIWHIVSWRFGKSALTVGVLALIVLGIVASFILNLDGREWIGAPGIPAVRWFAEGRGYLQLCLFLASLAAYYGLMQVAVRVKQNSETSL